MLGYYSIFRLDKKGRTCMNPSNIYIYLYIYIYIYIRARQGHPSIGIKRGHVYIISAGQTASIKDCLCSSSKFQPVGSRLKKNTKPFKWRHKKNLFQQKKLFVLRLITSKKNHLENCVCMLFVFFILRISPFVCFIMLYFFIVQYYYVKTPGYFFWSFFHQKYFFNPNFFIQLLVIQIIFPAKFA